jgi:predicted transcriptional regulator
MTKARTLRLDEDLDTELTMVARARGISTNELIQESLAEKIEAARRDPVFMARLRKIIEEDQEILKRLARR